MSLPLTTRIDVEGEQIPLFLASVAKKKHNSLSTYLSSNSDDLRWAVQVAATAGITSFLLTFLPSSQKFFGGISVIATILGVSAIDRTAGGSIRKSGLMALFGMFGVICGFVLFLAVLEADKIFQPFLVLLASALLIIFPTYIRSFHPSLLPGVISYLSASETLLTAMYSNRMISETFTHAAKRAVSATIGPPVAGIVSQLIMRKAARPALWDSLGQIILSISDLLNLLSTSLDASDTEQLEYHSSSSLISYTTPEHYPSAFLNLPSRDYETASLEDAIRDFSRYSMSYEATPHDKEYCHQLMDGIKNCQKLLADQKQLIQSATQEISWERPHLFHSKKYIVILNEIQSLFYYVASLAFTLNLYLSPPPITVGPSKHQFLRSKSAPFASGRASLNYHHYNVHLPTHCDFWNEVESGMIAKAIRHIALSLVCISSCVRNRIRVNKAVYRQVHLITKAIDEIDCQRRSRRQAFTEIVSRSLDGELDHVWDTEKNIQLDWQSAIGIKSSAFLQLSESDKSTYWDAYWLGRDRTSTSSLTLIILNESIRSLCVLIDEYFDSNSYL